MTVALLKKAKFGKWKFSIEKSPSGIEYIRISNQGSYDISDDIEFCVFPDGSFEIEMG